MERRIMVKNLSSSRVIIDNEELHFKRVWEQKGAVKPIAFEILEQLIYEPGVETLFKEGYLYIDDKDTRVELGLEEADGDSIVQLYTDAQIKRFLTIAPIEEFAQVLGIMAHEQIVEMADYAIDNELIDIEKDEMLKKKIGIDVIKTIQLKKANTEA
jgi:hypothetical protein